MKTKSEGKPYNEFDATVDAIVQVVRNPDVKLPLSIVINGDWGSGKSSVMNNVQGRLDNEKVESGFQPVTIWFNAWHLQGEKNLIDEFMLSLVKRRKDSQYPWWYLPMITLRRLYRQSFWGQLGFFLYIGLILPVGFMLLFRSIIPVFDLCKEHRELFPPLILEYWRGWRDIIFNAVRGTSVSHGTATIIGLVVSVISGLAYYMFQFVPSGISTWTDLVPMEGVKETKKEKPVGYRTRFKEQFWDLMDSADDTIRIVVFIDDLDRVNGAKILEMLEAINFIMDTASMPSGKDRSPAQMVFIIGMAITEVAKNLGAELNRVAPDGMDNRNRGLLYIEKLMNVVVPVPSQTVQQLFLHKEPDTAPVAARDVSGEDMTVTGSRLAATVSIAKDKELPATDTQQETIESEKPDTAQSGADAPDAGEVKERAASLTMDQIRSGFYFGWKIALLLIALAAGISLPWFAVDSYSKFLAEVDKNHWDRDTSYIKMANNYTYLENGPPAAKGKAGGTGGASPGSQTPADTVRAASSGDSGLSDTTAVLSTAPLRTPAIAVDMAEAEKAWLKANKASHGRSFIWWGLLGWFAGCLIAMVVMVYLSRLPKLIVRDKDRDPRDFVGLYMAFKEQIAELRTPRRIKRFSNKVRMQFNLLSLQGMIRPGDDSGFIFMTSLLLLEQLQEDSRETPVQSDKSVKGKAHWKADVKKVPPIYPDINNSDDSIHWLETMITKRLNERKTTKVWVNLSAPQSALIAKIYAMNKDLIYQNHIEKPDASMEQQGKE